MDKPNFDDPALWEIHDAIIFDEHEEATADGSVRKFTKADLERIATTMNHRAKQSLHCPVVIGHTRPGKPETEQPPHVGWALQYQVIYSHDLQRHVIRCKYYLKKDRAEEAKHYPQTSVEYWRSKEDDKDDFFNPIAIGIQTPARDIPPWTYGKSDHPGYACSRYTMESHMADPEHLKMPETPPETKVRAHEPKAPDPTHPPDAMAPEPEFHTKVMHSVHHAYPHLGAMHAKYMKEMQDGAHPGMDVDEPHKDGSEHGPEKFNAALSATNGAIPAAKKVPTEVSSTQYQRVPVMDPAVEKRIKALEEDRAKYARLYQRSERSKDLQHLKDSGILLDVEEELTDCESMGPEQYQRHLTKIKKNYTRDITSGDMVDVDRSEDDEFSTADLERAREYMKKNPGCDWAEAEVAAKKR